MKVVSADGVDIEPTLAKEILMGMAETYDVLFEVPEAKNYELRATAQDGTGFASGWLGKGEKVPAADRPSPDAYASMDHAGHGAHAEHHGHHAPVVETLSVDELKAGRVTAFPANSKIHDVKLVLGGDMERYVWHINGKAIHEERTLLINEGDVVRYTFENETMMHHPMHLHGHFFRVLNKNGEFSPLKHTVDVPPHSSRVIEFMANERGEWMLHCHNLFHMNTGMARVVKYSSFTPKPEIAHLQHLDHHLHDPWYFYGSAEAATNHGQASFRLSQTWNEIMGRVEGRNSTDKSFSLRDPWEVEGDLFYRRWFNQYFHLMAGGIVFDERASGAAGVGYLLPMLIESHLLLDHRGKFRLDLEKRFQWTRTIFTDVDFTWRPDQEHGGGHTVEYEATLMYGPSWSWAAGLMLLDGAFGAGLQVQF